MTRPVHTNLSKSRDHIIMEYARVLIEERSKYDRLLLHLAKTTNGYRCALESLINGAPVSDR